MKYEIIHRNFGKSGVAQKKLSPLSSRELPAQLHFIPPQKNSYPKNVANLLPKRCWFSFPELEFSRFSSFPCSFSKVWIRSVWWMKLCQAGNLVVTSGVTSKWTCVDLTPSILRVTGRTKPRLLTGPTKPDQDWLALEVTFSAEFFSHWIFVWAKTKEMYANSYWSIENDRYQYYII